LAGFAWLGPLSTGTAQQAEGVARRSRAVRPALDSLAQALDAVAGSQDSSAAIRDSARLQAEALRARLTTGDFRGGDRIRIWVEGAAAPGAIEHALSDTFTVGADGDVTLPAVGVISVRGVLRSELPDYLTRQIGRFINDPVVHVQSLIRVSVVGAVQRPGYYAVPVDALLSDALMVAGGPKAEAKLGHLRIDRIGKPLWRGRPLQRAISEGRTLDELDVRGGDQFIVPGPGRRSGYEVIRTVSLLLGIPLTILTLTKVF